MSHCSCGGCGCSNCTPGPRCTIQLPDQEVQTYDFENANLNGVGVLAGVDGTTVQFRGIVSESLALTVSLDAPNQSIVLDFDDALLIADIPTASETERGIAEVATQAETNAGIVDNVIVTPAKLAGRTATETRAGIAEVATQAEVNAGTNDTNFVTPLKLAAFGGAQLATTTFADAVARGAKVPAFAGQFGTQLDTDQGFVAYGTGAGEWYGLLTLGVTSTMYGSTSLDLNGSSLTLYGGSLVLSGSTTNTISGSTVFDNASVTLSNVTTLDYEIDTVLSVAGVPLSNSSFIGVDSGGTISEIEFSSFLSLFNTQNGYTTFANSSTIRTCDTASVTLQQLAQLVGTLIQDLKAVQLPAA